MEHNKALSLLTKEAKKLKKHGMLSTINLRGKLKRLGLLGVLSREDCHVVYKRLTYKKQNPNFPLQKNFYTTTNWGADSVHIAKMKGPKVFDEIDEAIDEIRYELKSVAEACGLNCKIVLKRGTTILMNDGSTVTPYNNKFGIVFLTKKIGFKKTISIDTKMPELTESAKVAWAIL